ncbi:MAG TPA: nitrilase-related carbon-nitrogen hydrolase [Steroidobacteraceae bacterium]
MGAQIIAGVNQCQPSGDLAMAIRPDGTVQRYDKLHLVPILEDRFMPGHDSGGLGGGLAMVICKDMDFPRTIRPLAAKGVRLMGVPAGDFGTHGSAMCSRGCALRPCCASARMRSSSKDERSRRIYGKT